MERWLTALGKALDAEEFHLATGHETLGAPRFAAVLISSRYLSTRYVVAVTPSEPVVATRRELKQVIRRARHRLTKSLTRTPAWKELATILVITAEPQLVDAAREMPGLFDRSGLHVNVLMGTFLVTPDRKRYTGRHTWLLSGRMQRGWDILERFLKLAATSD